MAEVLARRAVSQHKKNVRISKEQPVSETKTTESELDKKAVKIKIEEISAEASQHTASKSTRVSLNDILGSISKEEKPNVSGYSSRSRKSSSSLEELFSLDEDNSQPKLSMEAAENPVDNKKCSLPIEFEKESPKRPKATPENEVESRKKKAHRARTATATATAGDNGEQMGINSVQPAPVFVFGASAQVAEPMPAAKEIESQNDGSEEEVMVTTPKTSQKRKSLTTDDDEDAEQLPAKVAKPNPSSPVAAPTKIPTEEFIRGQMYVKQRDGSWKLSQSTMAPQKAPEAGPARKFIKYVGRYYIDSYGRE